MKLVWDKRHELGGMPAVHLLIVGISSYPNMAGPRTKPLVEGLKVPGAATTRSAVEVWRWFLTNSGALNAPLGTCRLLLSPQDADAEIAADLRHAVEPATVNRFVRSRQ